jgi:hypothetical protein
MDQNRPAGPAEAPPDRNIPPCISTAAIKKEELSMLLRRYSPPQTIKPHPMWR